MSISGFLTCLNIHKIIRLYETNLVKSYKKLVFRMYVRLISTYLSITYIKFVYGNSKKLKFIWERQAYTTSFQKVVLFDSYVILDLAMYNVLLNTVIMQN